MSDDLLKSHIDISFDNSITSAEKFEKAIQSLDSKFDSFDQRIKSLQNSMQGLNKSVGNKTGTDLRKKIEDEINNIIQSQGINLNLGKDSFRVSKTATDNLHRQIELEVNKELEGLFKKAKIELKTDGAIASQINLKESDIKSLNSSIIKLLKQHATSLAKSLEVQGSIPTEKLTGVAFELGKGKVNSIVAKIKSQLMPILLNPIVNNEGIALQLTEKELQKTLNQIKASLLKSITNSLSNFDSSKIPDFDSGMNSIFSAYGRGIKNFTDNMKKQASQVDTGLKIPFSSIDADLKRYIVKKTGNDIETIRKQIKDRNEQNEKIPASDLIKLRLEKDFSEIARTLYDKVRKYVKLEMTALKDAVNNITATDADRMEQTGFLSYVNKEVDKIQKLLINHLRKLTKAQLEAMERELANLSIQSPRTANVGGLIRRSDLGTPVRETTGSVTRSSGDGFGDDFFARRDAQFNRFGIEGAVLNTVRHLIAGSIVGTPMMALYQGIEAFRTGQLEQVKMLQNLMIKDDYQRQGAVGEGTKIDFNKVKNTISGMQGTVEGMALKYGVDLAQMYQTSTIGSRLLDNPKDIQKFMEYVSQVKVIDNEADIAKVVAPGLEAIMSQFQLGVDDLGKVVKAFAVATNATKATTEEILQALQRSGSLFQTSKVDIQSAIGLSALTIQATALSGENIGNFYKSLLVRLGSVETERLLARNNVPVYEKNEMGGLDKRSGTEILMDIVKLFKTGDDKLRDEIIRITAGTYQAGKLTATVAGTAMEKLGEIVEKMEKFTDADLSALLTESTQNTRMNMDRVRISTDIAFYSLLQELSPQINTLTSSIVGLNEKITSNSEGIAKLINVISQLLLGALGMYGLRRLYNASGYRDNLDNVRNNDRLFNNVSSILNRDTSRLIASEAISQLVRGTGFVQTLRNDSAVQRGMADPVLGNYLRTLANADEDRLRRFNEYIESRQIPINSPAEFLQAFRNSIDFGVEQSTTGQVLTQENEQRLARGRANDLLDTINLSDDVRDGLRNAFNDIGDISSFRPDMVRSLANFSDEDIESVRNNLNNRGGSIDLDILEQEVRTRQDYINQTSEDIRTQTRELNNLNDAFNRVNTNGFASTMNNVSENIRNAGQHMRSLARTTLDVSLNLAKMVAEMGAMVTLGAVMQDVMTAFSQTSSQRDVSKAESEVGTVNSVISYYSEDIGETAKSFKKFTELGNSLISFISGSNDRQTYKKVSEMDKEFVDFLIEKEGLKLERIQKGNENSKYDVESAVRKEAERLGKSQTDYLQEIADRFLSREGGELDKLNKARTANMEAMMKSDLITENDAKKLEEEKAKLRKQQEAENRKNVFFYNPSARVEQVTTIIQELESKNKGIYKTEAKALEKKGIPTDSMEFVRIREKQIDEMNRMYQDELDLVRNFIKDKQDALNKNNRDGDVFLNRENKIKDTLLEKEIEEGKAYLDELNIKLQPLIADNDSERIELIFKANQSRIKRQMSEINFESQKSSLLAEIEGDPQSIKNVRDAIIKKKSMIYKLNQQKRELELLDATGDRQGIRKEEINSVDLQILNTRKEIKDLELSKIGINHDKLSMMDRKREIELLRYRVDNKIYDESDPRIKKKQDEIMKERASALGKEEVRLQGLIKSAKDPQSKRLFEEQLLTIQEQSLKAQLGIHDTLKKGEGSFNLPRGVKPINEFDYFKAMSSHTSYVTQQGSTTLNFVINGGNTQDIIKTLGDGLERSGLISKGTSLSIQAKSMPLR